MALRGARVGQLLMIECRASIESAHSGRLVRPVGQFCVARFAMSQASLAVDPAPALQFYSIGERIGAGSFSVVYKGLSKQPNAQGVRDVFAIKCISRRRVANAAAIDNLVREIQLLRGCRHRHIVELLDFQWDEHFVYLVMELCGGGDLSRFIRQQRCLAEPVARRFLQQLASALQYLHARGIAHMDLKPQNILLHSRLGPALAVLKLADFGFAQYLNPVTGDTVLKGSPLYMAPEMFCGSRYDARIDLWSIGVILYECLFGRAPFDSGSYESLVAKITSTEPIVLPSQPRISDSCHDLLTLLLERDPRHRISFSEFFQHRFVDLEHAPSKDNYERGMLLARRAQAAEQKGSAYLAEAFRLHCKALDFLLPSLDFLESKQAREDLRAQLRRMIARAEALKLELRPPVCPRELHSERSLSELDYLKQAWADVPELEAAFTVVSAAEELESQGQSGRALEKYQLAIEPVLRMVRDEPPSSSRRRLLAKFLEKWIGQAERLKEYVELSQLRVGQLSQSQSEQENSAQLLLDGGEQGAVSGIWNSPQCVLQ